MQNLKLEAIYKDISSLSGNEKKILLSKLLSDVHVRSDKVCENSILQLKGLGKEIWNDADAQDYVDTVRTSWE